MINKKQIFLIICLLTFLFFKSTSAQITLDTIVHPWDGFGWDFYPVQISSSETKYYIQDTLNNTFSLYNMDFSPFLLNIAVPEPFAPFLMNYEVIYISRTLFDCDSTNIEYAYAAQSGNGNNRTFYIMRTDGTQLFRLDSAIAPYCFGCLNASEDVRPIINTSSGAKLFIYSPQNTNDLHIYSLCGSLLETGNTYDFKNKNQSFVKIFPNPSSGTLTFQINLPDNMNNYDLVIINSNAKEAGRKKINSGNNKYEIDVSGYSNGTYFYTLCTKNKAYQSGKFVLKK